MRPKSAIFDRPLRLAGRTRAFTLLEVLVAMAILSMLLAGMGSAVFLARKAVPDEKSGGSSILAAGQALNLLQNDLFDLTGTTELSSNGLSFTAADRNRDGSPESIVYRWSGVAGEPLTRSINGRPHVPIVNNVQEFALRYDRRRVPLPLTYNEGSEVLLAANATVNAIALHHISTSRHAAQYFKPNLPAGAVSWKVTRVQLRARNYSAAVGRIVVQLRSVDGIGPSQSILEQQTFQEDQLQPFGEWITVSLPFARHSGLTPGMAATLVVSGQNDSLYAATLLRDSSASPMSDRYFLYSNDGGTTWNALQTHSLAFRIYGTVTTPNPQQFKYVLTNVGVTLRVGEDVRSRAQTTIRVLNEPEVTGP